MMSSYRRSSGSGVRRILLASFVLFLIVAVDVVSGGAVRGTVRTLGAGAWRGTNGVLERVLGSGFFSSRRLLLDENRELKLRIAELESRAARVAVLEEEVGSLRVLARVAEERQGVSAPIVSSLISSPYGTFLIGAGSRDGVGVGDLVLTGTDFGSFVAGRVVEVGERVSLVADVFGPNAEIEAVIRDASVVVRGQGGRNGRTTVPDAVLVEAGDPVFSPPLGGRAVGVVGSAVHDPASASRAVYVHLPVNLAALKYVYVVPF